MAALCIWTIIRLIFADYIWKTDSDGLHISGLFNRKSIKWTDVSDVIPVETLASGTVYKLKTSDKVISLAPLTVSHSLIASVWQHLRRQGKARDIQLGDDTLSLWSEIPDAIPTEMQWVNTRSARLSGIVVSIIFFAAILIYFIVIAVLSGKVFMMLMAVILVPGYALMFKSIHRESFLRASSVVMTDEYIDVKLPPWVVHLPWSDVVSAGWEKISKGGDNYLQIKGRDSRSEVLIPRIDDDEESSKLILAIIRRLRTAGIPQALVIPAILRNQKVSPASDRISDTARMNGFVELRFLWWERLICGIPFAILIGGPVAIFLARGSDFTLQSLAVLVISYIAGFLITGAYSMKANDSGISKKLLLWSKTVRWSDVNSLMITESRQNQNVIRRILKGQDDQVLMSITMEFGGKQNYEDFIAFMNAKLAERLPADKINVPWKAG
ncbi:MAG: hypothetical protein ACYC27_15440 [Armatimonadota bacterium]